MSPSFREYKCFIIALIAFYLLYIVWLYPSVLDFYYINLFPYAEIIANHRIDILGTGVSGTQALTLILMETTGLSHLTANAIPLLLIPVFFLVTSVFRSLIKSVYGVLLAISFFLPFVSPGAFVLGCHDVGFLLYLTLILTLILNYRRNLGWCSTSIIVVLVIVCVNFISYKINALIILFLLFLFIFLMPMYTKDRRELPHKYAYMSLIGLIMAFGLNTFFYSNFVPCLEQSKFENIGIFKIVNIVDPSANLLVNHLYKPPIYLQYIGTLRFVLIAAVLGAIMVIFIRKIMRKMDLTYLDLIFLSTLFSGGSLLIVYTILGLFHYYYVFFSGYLGICLLSTYFKTSFNWSKVIIWILLLSGLLYMVIIVGSGYYMGHKGPDEFQYLAPPTLWLGNHAGENSNQYIKSDVLTIGYISYHSLKQETLTGHPKTYFSVDEVTQLIQPNDQKKSVQDTFFVINSNLHYIAIERWYHIKSLSNYISDVRNTCNFNIVYSTDLVDIAT